VLGCNVHIIIGAKRSLVAVSRGSGKAELSLTPLPYDEMIWNKNWTIKAEQTLPGEHNLFVRSMLVPDDWKKVPKEELTKYRTLLTSIKCPTVHLLAGIPIIVNQNQELISIPQLGYQALTASPLRVSAKFTPRRLTSLSSFLDNKSYEMFATDEFHNQKLE